MGEYGGIILGTIPPTCSKNEHYFYERYCFVDCRGPLTVSQTCYFGLGVKIVTTGHELDNWPEFGRMIFKPVVIEDGAWIGSFSILHNCRIGKHAIVSIGSVVSGLHVPDYAVAQGNPAKVVGYMYKGIVLPYERWIEYNSEP